MKFSPWQNPFDARACPVRAQPYNQPRTSPDNPVRWTEGTDRSNQILCAPVVASLFFSLFCINLQFFSLIFKLLVLILSVVVVVAMVMVLHVD